MGAFNNWVQGSYLEDPANRKAIDVAFHILLGAGYLYRVQSLRIQGVPLTSEFNRYQPVPLTFQ
jgi:trans-AT polyketide synthase, acyltransferase and oxidoreductase domains